MENNNFEKDFLRSFEKYQPQLNTDEIWENIEPQLKRKKSGGILFFWFLIAGLGIGFIFWNGLENSGEVHPEEAALIELEKDALKAENNSQFIGELSSTENQINSKNQNENILEQSDKEVFSKPFQTNKLDPQSHNSKSSYYPLSKVYNLLPAEQDQADKNAKQQDLEKESVKPSIPLESSEKDKAMNSKNSEKTPAALEIPKEELAIMETVEKQIEEISMPPIKVGWKHFLHASLAPVLPIKSLHSTISGGDHNLLQMRKATEKIKFAFAANANWSAQNKNGLLILAGFEYQQIQERFDLGQIYFSNEIPGTDIGVVKNIGGGDVSTRIAANSVLATTEQSRVVNNQHVFLQIPVGFGKSWNHGKATKKIFGGLTYNLTYTFKGSLIGPEREVFDLDKSEEEPYDKVFKQRAGLGLWIGGEYSRPMSDRLSWSVAPKLQVPVSSLTVKDFGFTQRYYTLSLNVGVNYLLNPKKKE